MALLQPQQIQVTGTAITYSAANASDTAKPDSRTFWHVKVGGTSTNLTVVVPGTQYGVARPDITVSGLTNTDRFFGPLVDDLADTSTGDITLLASQTVAVTSALVRI
jgi:hypothetical protein